MISSGQNCYSVPGPDWERMICIGAPRDLNSAQGLPDPARKGIEVIFCQSTIYPDEGRSTVS
jgi:hypothetical protein